MRELHTEVLRILNGHRDAGGAIRLWEKIHEAFGSDGVPGVRELIGGLTILPETEEEELGE